MSTLEQFLAGVEKQAFHMARYSTRDSDEALDIVQDAMLSLASRYAERPEDQWRRLFFRILHNRIIDWHRYRQNHKQARPEEVDPAESVVASRIHEPDHRHRVDGASSRLQQAVAELPVRQRQAYLLRALEGMTVKETARVMRCTQGSVKTHHFRALQALRTALEDHWE